MSSMSQAMSWRPPVPSRDGVVLSGSFRVTSSRMPLPPDQRAEPRAFNFCGTIRAIGRRVRPARVTQGHIQNR